MNIIKQCRTQFEKDGYLYPSVCVIRSNTYANSVDYITKLFNEAQKDFPDLSMTDVKAVVYGGDRIKNMTGIEFHLAFNTSIPKCYELIKELPPIK